MEKEKRAMASVRRIVKIESIPDADRIVLARVGGWQTIVKKDEFKEGELAVYCEIDSWIPNAVAPFLTKDGKEPKEYKGIKGEKLKSIRLRGCLSQGLLLPLSVLSSRTAVTEGDDVSEQLGIVKWEEPQVETNRLDCGVMRPLPDNLRKTSAPRVQNLGPKFWKSLRDRGITEFEISEKLDGMSCSIFLDKNGTVRLCSCNYEINAVPAPARKEPFLLRLLRRLGFDRGSGHRSAPERENLFQEVLRKSGVGNALKVLDIKNLALQGEITGPGARRNPLKLEKPAFFLFSVWDIENLRELDPDKRMALFENVRGGLVPEQHEFFRHVPVIGTWNVPENDEGISEELLKMADGASRVNPKVMREGLVFKPVHGDGTKNSFKAVSNEYLLKKG